MRHLFAPILLALPLAAQAIVLDNGIPIGTEGHLSVDVLTGGATESVVFTTQRHNSTGIITKNVVSSYRVFIDPGIDGQGFELRGSEPEIVIVNSGNVVRSSGSFIGANGNIIHWTTDSSMAEGLDTAYRFTADGNTAEPIGPLRVLQYLDGGIQGSSRDVFLLFSAGPITDENPDIIPRIDILDDIRLFGVFLYEQTVMNSTFVGSAVDRFNQIQDRITGSGQPVSISATVTNLPGFQFSYQRLRTFAYGPANIASVLAWDVNPGAHDTSIGTTLEGSPTLPPCERSDEETCGRPAVKPAKDQFSCRTTGCAIPVTCKLTAPCKTKTKLLVTPESIRLKKGVKAQRRIKFAAAVTNIPPGKTLTVRPILTKQGKRLVRANRNRIIDGVMSIRNAATGDLFSSTPVRIRLR